MNQTATWRRKIEEYEADLYRNQTVKFLGFSFQSRAKSGEIEVKKYDNGGKAHIRYMAWPSQSHLTD